MHQTSISDFSGYLFDLDGTIYIGSQVIQGADAAIRTLQNEGKTVMFATNTTLYTREQVRDKLVGFGIDCTPDEVITALSVAGTYFRDHAPQACIFPLGDEAMLLELSRSGLQVTEQSERATHVFVGLDRSFDFNKMTAAVNAVRNGAILVAANPDPFCPMEDGVIPDTWSLIRAIETASNRNTDVTLGKPSVHYASHALQKLGARSKQCLMVGDKLETDIALGQRIGMATALVLTGVDTEEDIALTGIRPDFVLSSVNAISEHYRLKSM